MSSAESGSVTKLLGVEVLLGLGAWTEVAKFCFSWSLGEGKWVTY